MKKLLFSAMACIAFAGSAFASNEVVDSTINQDEYLRTIEKLNNSSDDQTIYCTVIIDYRINGRSYSYTAHSMVENGQGCSSFADLVANELAGQGYLITGCSAVSSSKGYEDSFGRP